MAKSQCEVCDEKCNPKIYFSNFFKFLDVFPDSFAQINLILQKNIGDYESNIPRPSRKPTDFCQNCCIISDDKCQFIEKENCFDNYKEIFHILSEHSSKIVETMRMNVNTFAQHENFDLGE